MKNQYIILFFLFLTTGLSAQEITVVAQKNQKSIQLHWQPSNFEIFWAGVQEGYTIERKVKSGQYEVVAEKVRPRAATPNAQEIIKNPTENDEWIYRWYAKPNDINEMRGDAEGQKMLDAIRIFTIENSLISPENMRSSGLFYEDKTANLDNSYTYRVSIGGKYATEATVELQQTKLPELVIKSGDLEVLMEWKHDTKFAAYAIQRSEDNKNFTSISEYIITYDTELVNNSDYHDEGMVYYQDSVTENYKVYYYRLVGIDAFSNQTISNVSVMGRGINLTPPTLPNDFIATSDEASNSFTLSWDKKEMEDDFIGYKIYRSSFPDSLFTAVTDILPKKSKNYKDVLTTKTPYQYYQIGVLDKDGNEAISNSIYAVFPDKTPPAIPSDLKGTMSKEGIVSLRWTANKEKDLFGYALAGAWSEKSDFVRISGDFFTTNTYIDTLPLNVQNDKYYYRIAAIDQQGNMSDYSNVVIVTLPDTLAPPPIQWSSISINQKNKAVLTWRPTIGDEVAITISRKMLTDSIWTPIKTLKTVTDTLFVDDADLVGTYQYTFQTMDEAGNISPYAHIRTIKINPINRENLTITAKAEKGEGITLNWSTPMENKNNYLIFRGLKGEQPQLIQSIKGVSFVDKKAKKGERYTYFVIEQLASGKTGLVSEEVTVKY